MLSIEDACGIASEGTRYYHSIAVGSMMRILADHHGEDPELWEMVGILHDIDYDETKGKREMHGVKAAEKLRNKLPENALYAIMSHDHRTGYTPSSELDKALIFADSLEHVLRGMDDFKTFDKVTFQNCLIQQTEKGRPWMRETMETYIT